MTDETVPGTVLPAEVSAVLAERAETWTHDGETMPLVDKTTTDRRQITVYSTMTGDPHRILRIDLRNALRLTRPDGKPSFWAPGMPGEQPKRNIGKLKCFLHPESDERALVDQAGYAGRNCNDGDPSKNNQSSFQAMTHKLDHERRKHPGAFAAVTELKQRVREQEILDLQRMQVAAAQAQLEAMKAMAEQVPTRRKAATE